MSNIDYGMSGRNFDAFVSSQRSYTDFDFAAKLQQKYWRARQKFLAKIEKNEDSCIVLSDSKLDAKLDIYKSIDKSCARLIDILEDYQNYLYVYANEESSLATLLKECSKHDKTKAGKIQAIVSKSLAQSSHQRIRLYMPLLRMYQEMETFHSRAVDDTAETVDKLEGTRSQYRASLLWLKDISERLDPDTYRKLDEFRRVQSQVRSTKREFDKMQMDVVQKIDLVMASRCNLLNQILAAYQETLMETFERNYNNFRSVEELIKKEDIYEYEFKALKQLNPIKIDDEDEATGEAAQVLDETAREQLLLDLDSNNNEDDDAVAAESEPDGVEAKKDEHQLLLDFFGNNTDNGESTKPNSMPSNLLEDKPNSNTSDLIDISPEEPDEFKIFESIPKDDGEDKNDTKLSSSNLMDELDNIFQSKLNMENL